MQKRFCVIGSGPTGVAATYQLLKMGHQVLMLDVGKQIEADLIPLTTANDQDFQRDAHFRAVYAARDRHKDPNDAELPLKKPFGSNFAYRPNSLDQEVTRANAFAVVSHAQGGLSQAWGANVSRIRDSEMTAWPIRRDDLDAGFETVSEIVDVAGDNDAIDTLYDRPLFHPGERYPLGAQGASFLKRARQHQKKLTDRGLYIGKAKLAIGPRYSVANRGCRGCGACMHGCPYHAIYNSADTLAVFKRNPNFTYLPEQVALKFSEAEGSVLLEARSTSTGERKTFSFAKLFIGAGTLGSTALVARSLNWCDRTFIIKDSQKYLFPYFRFTSRFRSWKNPPTTMAQIFVQTLPKNEFRLIHGQLYGYNDLLVEPLRRRLGWCLNLILKLSTPVLDRLLIGMIYLHSDDSGHMEFRVEPNESNGLGRLTGIWSAKGDRAAKSFISQLNRFWRPLGGFASYTLSQPNRVGESLHFGASLPMSAAPEPGQTDRLGRPFSCQNVHVIDTSIFSSIPATPTTYLAMANAIRIVQASASS